MGLILTVSRFTQISGAKPPCTQIMAVLHVSSTFVAADEDWRSNNCESLSALLFVDILLVYCSCLVFRLPDDDAVRRIWDQYADGLPKVHWTGVVDR